MISNEVTEYLQTHGRIPTWHGSQASDPAHQWAAAVVHLMPAGWLPAVHVGFLTLCKVKAKETDRIEDLLNKTKRTLMKLFEISEVGEIPHPKRFVVRQPEQVKDWLAGVSKKLIEERLQNQMSDEIDVTKSKRRASGGTKKKAKKTVAKKAASSGRGRPSTFEGESDFLRMLKRKSGVSVTEAAEKLSVEPAVIRKQIDRLRRGGHDIERGDSKGVFVLR